MDPPNPILQCRSQRRFSVMHIIQKLMGRKWRLESLDLALGCLSEVKGRVKHGCYNQDAR
jgi:hypothetical protein